MTTLFHSARKLDAAGQVDDFWMLVDGDTIAQTGSGPAETTAGWEAATERVDVAGRWLVPGFIDIHGHGGGGASYDEGRDAISTALAAHRAHGTTRSVLSLVTNPLVKLSETLTMIAEFTATDPLILGSHLEGPFLSDARRGAHNPDFLIEPLPGAIEELLEAGHETIRQVTIAPELPGAMEAIDILVEHGIVVAVGHSEFSFELAQEAFDRGARLLTHAFNAMPGIHHRKPGPVIAAFEDERVTLELILDGMHVHPDVAAMAFAAAPGRIALITDAMAAAASHDGDYILGSLNVSVKDGRAVLSGTSSLAGSTLTQDTALRIAIERVKLTPTQAIEALTLTPARVLGLEHEFGYLKSGYVADTVLLDHEWQVTSVWGAGRQLT
ncbi:MAG: N-acetylglucosamine-6-phosphate deacetylase [Lacisediminihabitans sp.]